MAERFYNWSKYHVANIFLSSYNWGQPSTHLILPSSQVKRFKVEKFSRLSFIFQVKIPPRPPGKPPSWSERAPYFPPVTSNSIDDYNELNMVQTEPEVENIFLLKYFSDKSIFRPAGSIPPPRDPHDLQDLQNQTQTW